MNKAFNGLFAIDSRNKAFLATSSKALVVQEPSCMAQYMFPVPISKDGGDQGPYFTCTSRATTIKMSESHTNAQLFLGII